MFLTWFKKPERVLYALSFLVLTGLLSPATAQAQQATFSVKFEKQTLEQALVRLRTVTGASIAFNKDEVAGSTIAEASYENKTVAQLLRSLLAGLPFTAEKKGTAWLVKKTPPLAATPATGTVTGRVTDARSNQPVPYANITLGGKTIPAGEDGGFSATLPAGSYEADISSSGYKPGRVSNVVIEGGKTSELAVQLTPGEGELNAVVVVGYGNQKRSDLTGAIGSIRSPEIQLAKAPTSFLEKIQGRMAGVQIVSSSGEPGTSVNVTIRGANSVNAASAPLYVIDGVQMEASNTEIASASAYFNPLASINAADIESIDVLKDASATAIYGSRGANGVIIITTKSGRDGSNLEFNASVGFASPSKKISLLNGQEYADYRFFRDPNSTVWGETVNGVRQVKDFSGADWHDWQDEVLRTARTQDYTVQYSGGNAKTKFSSSLGYLNQQGILDRNRFERYSLNLKIDHTASKKFRIGTSLNGSYNLGTGVASSNGQTQNLFGVIQNLIMFKPIYLPGQSYDEIDPETLSVSNPRVFINDSYKKTPFTKIILNAYGEYNILRDLELRASLSGVITNSENGEFYPSTTSWGEPRSGLAQLNTASTLNWLQTNTLTYRKRFRGGHSLNTMLGVEANSAVAKSFDMQAEGFDLQSINPLDDISQGKVLSRKPTTFKQKSNRFSQFGRINYNFANKYYATATLRRDGSSKFGAGKKYAWFPSAALAWTVSGERFMQRQHLFDNVKLRASFGVTGNDRIPPYQSLANGTVVFYPSAGATNDPGIAFVSIANPDLKWETTTQYDAGLDVELLNERLAFTLDVYRKETRDMLLNADIPAQTGFGKQWQNIGRVDNKGIEFTLNSTNIRNKDFSWTSSFNITFNRNKVVSLGGTSSIPVAISGHIETVGRVIEGQPLGTGYGFIFDGIYQEDDFVDPASGTYVLKPGVVKRAGLTVQPGYFKFKDLTGDNEIDSRDATVISNSNPKHFGGLNNTFSYKGIDLSIFFQWSYGNDIMNVGRYRYEGYQANNLSTDFWYNRWTPDNPSNEYPALFAEGRYDASTYYVEDGSYLRLKNVTIGYSLPAGLIKRMHIKGFHVFITGENLVTWTNYSGFDPEVASRYALMPGLDMISYPRARSFTAGVNVQF
ncbi:MAG: TonB-dependent receptor [Chitinophagaceae bacterium]